MSRVINLSDAQAEKIDKWIAGSKTGTIDQWQEVAEENAEKLICRFYDQIKLTDDELDHAGMQEHLADSLVLTVIANVLVNICESRNVLSPSKLLKAVREVIKNG